MKFINTASFHSFSFESIYIKIEHVQIQENYERTEARQMSIIDIITPVFMMTVLIAIGVITSKVIDVSVAFYLGRKPEEGFVRSVYYRYGNPSDVLALRSSERCRRTSRRFYRMNPPTGCRWRVFYGQSA